jgi:hypothetical protein
MLRLLRTGQAPQELEPGGKVAIELQRLCMFISQHVNMTRDKLGEKRSHFATGAGAEAKSEETPRRRRVAAKLQGAQPQG